MTFLPTQIEGLYEVRPQPIPDNRGFFARFWSSDEATAHGIEFSPVQVSTAYNHAAATLRGLHWQVPPFDEIKLLKVVRGAIWDVIVDLRPGSVTRLQWQGFRLDAQSGSGLCIPAGCAHGYITIADCTEVLYLMDKPHRPEAARGARWDDPRFGIEWPVEPQIIADRDTQWPDYRGDFRVKILVTGASGYVGRRAIAPLQQLGFEVHIVGRRNPDAPGTTFHSADLLDETTTAGVVDALQPSHLLHCAWDVTHGGFWNAPENLDWVAATLKLTRRFVRNGGKRFVGVGTCAEYDWSGNYGMLRRESDAARPQTLYGHAKLATGALLQAFLESKGVGFAWGRVFHVFGPGEPQGRLIPTLARAVLREEPARCSSGAHLMDYLPVEDAGAALARITATDVNGVVNIASGQPRPVSELARMLALLANKGPPAGQIVADESRPSGPEMLANVSRLRNEVGFVPGSQFEEALLRSLAFWKNNL